MTPDQVRGGASGEGWGLITSFVQFGKSDLDPRVKPEDDGDLGGGAVHSTREVTCNWRWVREALEARRRRRKTLGCNRSARHSRGHEHLAGVPGSGAQRPTAARKTDFGGPGIGSTKNTKRKQPSAAQKIPKFSFPLMGRDQGWGEGRDIRRTFDLNALPSSQNQAEIRRMNTQFSPQPNHTGHTYQPEPFPHKQSTKRPQRNKKSKLF
jgi:hypothetical protein